MLHRRCGLYACLVMVGQLNPGVPVLGGLCKLILFANFLRLSTITQGKCSSLLFLDANNGVWNSVAIQWQIQLLDVAKIPTKTF